MSEMRWIPVTEKLPENGLCGYSKNVLITYEINGARCVATATLQRTEVRGKNVVRWKTTFAGRILEYEVIAWMPFPEPYKELYRSYTGGKRR